MAFYNILVCHFKYIRVVCIRCVCQWVTALYKKYLYHIEFPKTKFSLFTRPSIKVVPASLFVKYVGLALYSFIAYCHIIIIWSHILMATEISFLLLGCWLFFWTNKKEHLLQHIVVPFIHYTYKDGFDRWWWLQNIKFISTWSGKNMMWPKRQEGLPLSPSIKSNEF